MKEQQRQIERLQRDIEDLTRRIEQTQEAYAKEIQKVAEEISDECKKKALEQEQRDDAERRRNAEAAKQKPRPPVKEYAQPQPLSQDEVISALGDLVTRCWSDVRDSMYEFPNGSKIVNQGCNCCEKTILAALSTKLADRYFSYIAEHVAIELASKLIGAGVSEAVGDAVTNYVSRATAEVVQYAAGKTSETVSQAVGNALSEWAHSGPAITFEHAISPCKIEAALTYNPRTHILSGPIKCTSSDPNCPKESLYWFEAELQKQGAGAAINTENIQPTLHLLR